ncbi:hypothetical protein [Amycolatopsis sp. WQ 127309]|uniref:hypothetical protein n=1 Tax=Amycolatopsis sp. WQ 127309 TaxID=2932773 RepID=UPI001FF513F0|nr:hypothetical protein [Amycolatopsis sp. WQ 127309]UOZ10556.1 hypothetical protein MUY22_20735 [Amycolatopsis sp. WQ 127309]
MSAVIHIDPEAIHPVIDGLWHRTRLRGIPEPGEPLLMLCGIQGVAVFDVLAKRRERGVPHQCPRCEVIYRRERGIASIPIKQRPA